MNNKLHDGFLYGDGDFMIVKVGNTSREIRSYNSIAQAEMPIMEKGYQVLSQQGYMDILFYNLGYGKSPNYKLWDPLTMSIEDCIKDQEFKFPDTINQLILPPADKCTLYDLLNVIDKWFKGSIEKGSVVVEDKSFNIIKDKDGNTIRDCSVANEMYATANIFKKRLHEICPSINKGYFIKCIHKFTEYSKQIKLPRNNQYNMFSVALMNPKFIMDAIKDAEIRAADELLNGYGNQYLYISDYDKAVEFRLKLWENFSIIEDKFIKQGFSGFADNNGMTPSVSSNMVIPSVPFNYLNILEMDLGETLQRMNIPDKRRFIFNIPLEPAIMRYIDLHFDTESIPDRIPKTVTDPLSHLQIKNPTITNTLRRIFVVLRQLEKYDPQFFMDLFGKEGRLTLTNSLFINESIFSLYSITHQANIVCSDDMTFTIIPATSCIEYYKTHFNISVLKNNN